MDFCAFNNVACTNWFKSRRGGFVFHVHVQNCVFTQKHKKWRLYISVRKIYSPSWKKWIQARHTWKKYVMTQHTAVNNCLFGTNTVFILQSGSIFPLSMPTYPVQGRGSVYSGSRKCLTHRQSNHTHCFQFIWPACVWSVGGNWSTQR